LDSLATVVESQLVSDLAKPADKNGGLVVLGKNRNCTSWSWGVLHDESVNYETSKQFIEYASDMRMGFIA